MAHSLVEALQDLLDTLSPEELLKRWRELNHDGPLVEEVLSWNEGLKSWESDPKNSLEENSFRHDNRAVFSLGDPIKLQKAA